MFPITEAELQAVLILGGLRVAGRSELFWSGDGLQGWRAVLASRHCCGHM